MPKWEYARVDVVLYDEGSGGGRQELLYLTLPGDDRKHVTNQRGSIGLLNELGLDGWELVDAEPQLFYLKRPRK
jgi:hypothetical protein